MDFYFDEVHEETVEMLSLEEEALLDLESALDYLDCSDDGVSLEL